MTDEEHAALDLYLSFEVGPHHNHFTAELYRLIAKADTNYRNKLSLSFPLHVKMYKEWMATEDRHAFYDKYNCKTNFHPEEIRREYRVWFRKTCQYPFVVMASNPPEARRFAQYAAEMERDASLESIATPTFYFDDFLVEIVE